MMNLKIVCSRQRFHLEEDSDYQGPDFDDMSSLFPCVIDDAIQYINLEYGAQASKIVILK